MTLKILKSRPTECLSQRLSKSFWRSVMTLTPNRRLQLTLVMVLLVLMDSLTVMVERYRFTQWQILKVRTLLTKKSREKELKLPCLKRKKKELQINLPLLSFLRSEGPHQLLIKKTHSRILSWKMTKDNMTQLLSFRRAYRLR